MSEPVTGSGTKDDPWVLRTPPGQSEYLAYRDPNAVPPTLVCVVGKTALGYRLQCLEDLHTMLSAHGDWMALAQPTSRSQPQREPWRRGRARPRTRLVAGTGSRRVSAGASPTTCRR